MAQFIIGTPGPSSRLGTPGAQFMFGNTTRGPGHGWECSKSNLCLIIPVAQFMFVNAGCPGHGWEPPRAQFMFWIAQGPVYIWECQGPSLCLGMPGAVFMFKNARDPVNVWEFQAPS